MAVLTKLLFHIIKKTFKNVKSTCNKHKIPHNKNFAAKSN